MGWIQLLLAATAAMDFLNKAIPQIRDAFKRGEIPAEEQEEVRRKYEELRAQGGGAFEGPEYELSGR